MDMVLAPPPVPLDLKTILHLDVDCVEELFEWLSLKDLLAIRRTCKRLKTIVDYHIETNYPAYGFINKTIYISCHSVTSYSQLVDFLIKRIKEVNVMFSDIPSNQIEGIKAILCQAKKIEVMEWYWDHEINHDFYELFFKFCTNTTHLSISNIQHGPIIGTGNEWLLRHYPKLEHLQLDDNNLFGLGRGDRIMELGEFFKLNSNLRRFSTTFQLLKQNADILKVAKVKLNELSIYIDYRTDTSMRETCELLNDLHQNEVYKLLHLFVEIFDSKADLQQISSVLGIEKLRLTSIKMVTSPFVQLKELCIGNGEYFADLDSVSRNFLAVERIDIVRATSNFIMPFIQHLPKLKHLKVLFLGNGTNFDGSIVDLSRMNQERKQLNGARKFTLYVHEKIFLATKWATKNICFSLIELKRLDAYETNTEHW